ncbi:MAG: Rne/Rng family ribonuclease [Arenicella sp.]|nr:Rne/Rng family ribonuclease [Arenicella sp.]
MNREILISTLANETRAAVIENGLLQDLHVEYADAQGLVGNIYKAQVKRILPGMQAAFLDIGLTDNAFLHRRDIFQSSDTPERHNGKADARLPIERLLHEGQRLLVQVTKDRRGDKGASLTTRLSLPSRYLVYQPFGNHITVSRRIVDAEQRAQLASRLEDEQRGLQLDGGIIARTAASAASAEDIRRDLGYLSELWQDIQSQAVQQRDNCFLYQNLPLGLRLLRDSGKVAELKVVVDSRTLYSEVLEFMQAYQLNELATTELYCGDTPLLAEYNLEQHFADALQREVILPSGARLVFDRTEAMTVIDVNTAAFTGRDNPAQTIMQANTEAAIEIARQLRMRNIGGIIVVDFIDMQTASDKQQLVKIMRGALESDPVAVVTADISPLGLMEITRRQSSESLHQQMCEPCEVCGGTGSARNPRTICYQIMRDLHLQDQQFQAQSYTVAAADKVVDQFEGDEAQALAELRNKIAGSINLQRVASANPQHYDISLG